MRGARVGIDIGTTTVTTLVARGEKDAKIRVLGVGSAPSAGLRRGVVVDAEETARSLRHSVEEASRASGMAIRSASVAVGGAHVGSFLTRGFIAVSRADGEITEEDVARVIQSSENAIPRSPNREVIHVIPRAFKVDGEGGIANPVGMVGMKLEVEALVIDGAKSALQNVARACDLAGVEVEDWRSGILAAAEVLLSKQQKELGVILLDLGAGTSDFAIFEEGRVVDVGSIPIGGGHITSDIAIGLRTQVAIAEEIKLRHAQAFSDGSRPIKRDVIRLTDFVEGDPSEFATRDLAEIVNARLSDIFELTGKALRKVGRVGLLPGGIVLTGGVTDTTGIQDLARHELKLPAEVAKAISLDAITDVLPTRFAIPLGLILWGNEGSGYGASRMQRRWSDAVAWTKRLLQSLVP